MKPIIIAAVTLLIALGSTGSALADGLTGDQVLALVTEIDARQRNTGDYKSLVYLKDKQVDKDEVTYELVVYRRDAEDRFMGLFLAPKADAGKGYLSIGDNLWLYTPSTGKWERVTERTRIAGTGGRRADFDQSRLAEKYDASYVAAGKLGNFATHKLKLVARADEDVPWPVIELEVDQASGNVLKRQEFALSGRLMQTTYFPKWHKIHSPSKGGDVWYPKEIRFYDELEKGRSSVVIVKKVDLRPLDKNIFTKAWLESKSR